MFHSPEGEPFLSTPVNGHFETYAIGTNRSDFRDWLGRLYYGHTNKVAPEGAIREAASVLAGKARYEGPERPVFLRIAEHDGCIYVDLANERWQAVKISSDGWEIVDNPPVKFKRTEGMLALPSPAPGGNLNQLRAFVNVGGEDHWVLLVAWLIAALRPTGPYPVLVLQGSQGSAKSTLSKILRLLIDPNTAPARSAPRADHDLMISAACGWCLAFDNLSDMPDWLSDALCRLATGAALSIRRYYSDNSERLFQATRPIMINGIDVDITRGDLLDRSLVLSLPSIESSCRRTEGDFWPEFERARPEILGALFTAVSASLRYLPEVSIPALPRMADFAKWVTAAESALGWAPGAFLAAYSRNRIDSNDLALEGSVLVPAIEKLLETGPCKETATELLSALKNAVTINDELNLRGWPSDARGLSLMLRRLEPNLKNAGIDIQFSRTKGPGSKKLISLARPPMTPPAQP